MSWISELTSRAEAMLVKLDQDTAQALQQPDGLFKGSILNQAINNLSSNRGRSHFQADLEQEEPQTGESINSQSDNQPDTDSQLNPKSDLGELSIVDPPKEEQDSIRSDFEPDALTSRGNSSPKPTTSSKKFKIQTSKASYRSLIADKRSERLHKKKEEQATSLKSPISMLEADDIRASINQSLSEYSMKHFNSQASQKDCSNSTTYSSHFDNQPNLIPHSPETDSNCDKVGIRSSPSFSIEVPEEWPSNSSEDIAARLLRHNALKKKSTFYLHRVINQLAGSNGRATRFITDEMRIKMGRVRLRATSYARQLNYYFRAYPMMKYVMLGYLVLMQLLVVYVLFFYQSSGSTNDISTQIKQQQQGLTDGSKIGEKNQVT